MYLQWFNSDIYSGTYGKNSCIFIFIYSSTYSGIYKETDVFTVVFMEKPHVCTVDFTKNNSCI
jgi:hypothetical protein